MALDGVFLAIFSDFSFKTLTFFFLSLLDSLSDFSAFTPFALYFVELSTIDIDPLASSIDFNAPGVTPEIAKSTASESFPDPINLTPLLMRLITPVETKEASSYFIPDLIFPLSIAFCKLITDSSVQLFLLGLLKPRLGRRM